MLVAEDSLLHGGVAERLCFDDFAVTEGEYIRFLAGFSTGRHFGQNDDNITVERNVFASTAVDFSASCINS